VSAAECGAMQKYRIAKILQPFLGLEGCSFMAGLLWQVYIQRVNLLRADITYKQGLVSGSKAGP